jgi:hypothetical protein
VTLSGFLITNKEKEPVGFHLWWRKEISKRMLCTWWKR